MHVDSKNFHGNLNGFLVTFSTNFHILPLKCVIPNFVACFVFLGMAFPFIQLISSSDTLTKREVVILKICPLTIITSAEVIIANMTPFSANESARISIITWVIILKCDTTQVKHNTTIVCSMEIGEPRCWKKSSCGKKPIDKHLNNRNGKHCCKLFKTMFSTWSQQIHSAFTHTVAYTLHSKYNMNKEFFQCARNITLQIIVN